MIEKKTTSKKCEDNLKVDQHLLFISFLSIQLYIFSYLLYSWAFLFLINEDDNCIDFSFPDLILKFYFNSLWRIYTFKFLYLLQTLFIYRRDEPNEMLMSI